MSTIQRLCPVRSQPVVLYMGASTCFFDRPKKGERLFFSQSDKAFPKGDLLLKERISSKKSKMDLNARIDAMLDAKLTKPKL